MDTIGRRELAFGIVVIVAVTLLLGVAFPACLNAKRKAVVECIKANPMAKPEECKRAISE